MQQIKSLTALSGMFILFIVIHHLGLYPGGGSIGVTFFFMASGFKLTLGYSEKVISSDFSYSKFILKRVKKFYPLHWLCMVLMIPIVYSFIQNGVFEQKDVLLSILPNALLLHSFIPVWDYYFSWNSVSWYLCNTMVFAAAFPFILRFIKNKRINTLLLVMATVLIYILVAFCVPKSLSHAIMYINPVVRVADFIIGIFLAFLFLGSKRGIKSSIAFVIAALSFLLTMLINFVIPGISEIYSIVYWIPLSILILSAANLQLDVKNKLVSWCYAIITWIGSISFPIFMLHKICIKYSSILLNLIHLNTLTSRTIFVFISTLCLSFLLDKYFVKPIAKWKK